MKKIAVGLITVFSISFASLQTSTAQKQSHQSQLLIQPLMQQHSRSIMAKLFYEVCITWKRSSCPNGKGFQEGKGAATF
jgi:hypothetical protein